jgi:glucose/arabinose dehydrogenase
LSFKLATDDIITGLPISDHDHGINAIEFGDEGELYINVGSNTNGGIPGQLTGSQL